MKLFKGLQSKTSMALMSILVALISFGLMVVTGILLNPLSDPQNLNFSNPLFLVASLLLLIALKFAPSFQISSEKTDSRSMIPLIHWGRVGIGIGLLLLLIQINVMDVQDNNLEWLLPLADVHYHFQILLFVSALASLIWGLGGEKDLWKRLNAYFHYWRDRSHWKYHHFLLAGIMLIAIIARVWNLESAVANLIDENHYMDGVRHLRTGNVYILRQFAGVTAFSWLFPYLQSLMVTLTEPNLSSLRIISAGFGIAEVFALYHLGTVLLHRRFGLICALLLATFPVHIHFSRIGIANIAEALFAILAFYFIVLGIRTRRPLHFALAGLCLGLTSYFYEAGRILFLPFTLCWLTWLLLLGKSYIRGHLLMRRNWLIMLTSLFAVLFALYFTWFANDLSAFPRFTATQTGFSYWEQVSKLNSNIVVTIITVIKDTFLTLIHTPDGSTFYAARFGLIQPELVPLFLIGIVVSLYRIRHIEGSLLFWWVMAVVIGNTFIGNRYHSARYVLVYPALMLQMALGIEAIILLIFRNRLVYIQNILIAIMVICIAVFQLNYYFGTHLPNYYKWGFYSHYSEDGILIEELDDAYLSAVQLPDNTVAHIISKGDVCVCIFPVFTQYYERDGEIEFQYRHPDKFTEYYLDGLDPSKNHAFFLNQVDRHSFDLINQRYSLGDPIFSSFNFPHDKQFVMYFVLASP